MFRQSAGNFNIPMCKAAKISIVEVEEIVEVGQIGPSEVISFIVTKLFIKQMEFQK